MQRFAQTAFRLRCDDDLPIVVLLDDYVEASKPNESLEHAATVKKFVASS